MDANMRKQWESMKSQDADLVLLFAVNAVEPTTGQWLATTAYAAFGDDAAWLSREIPKLCHPEGEGVAFFAGYLESVLEFIVSQGRRAAVLERAKGGE